MRMVTLAVALAADSVTFVTRMKRGPTWPPVLGMSPVNRLKTTVCRLPSNGTSSEPVNCAICRQICQSAGGQLTDGLAM